MPVFFLSSRLSYLSYRRYARLIFLRFLFIQSHTLNCSMIHATVISSYRHMLFLLFFYNPIKAVKLQISLIFHRFFCYLLFLMIHEPFFHPFILRKDPSLFSGTPCDLMTNPSLASNRITYSYSLSCPSFAASAFA